MSDYTATTDELARRIRILADSNPEILNLKDPWHLFKFGLYVNDLGPSLFQVTFALRKVQTDEL